MDKQALILQLHRIGVFQFGRFVAPDGNITPFTFQFGMIPSYPALLHELAASVAPLLNIEGVSHLFCSPTAIPLATACSLITTQPLTYPALDDHGLTTGHVEGSFDYDIPTVMLTDLFTDGVAQQAWIKKARSAGLQVKSLVSLIDLTSPQLLSATPPQNPATQAYHCAHWATMPEVITTLTRADLLTPRMHAHIMQALGISADAQN